MIVSVIPTVRREEIAVMTLLRSVPVGDAVEVELPIAAVTVVTLATRKETVVKISGNNVQVNFRNQVHFGF